MLFLQDRAGVHWTRLVFEQEKEVFQEEDWQFNRINVFCIYC